MPKYITDVDRFLSHESRMVKAGEEFETEFPLVGGHPMRLSDTLRLVGESKPRRGRKAADESAQDAESAPVSEDGVS